MRPSRQHRVSLRLTDEEYGAVVAAAARTGLTTTGWAAHAVVALASGSAPPAEQRAREALVELIQARTQVRRYATNVNQAVAVLHATGRAPEWLAQAVIQTNRATERLDAAADRLHRRLR